MSRSKIVRRIVMHEWCCTYDEVRLEVHEVVKEERRSRSPLGSRNREFRREVSRVAKYDYLVVIAIFHPWDCNRHLTQ